MMPKEPVGQESSMKRIVVRVPSTPQRARPAPQNPNPSGITSYSPTQRASPPQPASHSPPSQPSAMPKVPQGIIMRLLGSTKASASPDSAGDLPSTPCRSRPTQVPTSTPLGLGSRGPLRPTTPRWPVVPSPGLKSRGPVRGDRDPGIAFRPPMRRRAIKMPARALCPSTAAGTDRITTETKMNIEKPSYLRPIERNPSK